MTERPSRSVIAAGDLERVVELFGLGEINHVSFIQAGLMNPNWRLETSCGVFALKLIVDVSLETARRSLNVLESLGGLGLPVCTPSLVASNPVLEIGSRGYCVFPWAEGMHRPGASLTDSEAGTLGRLLGRVHLVLRSPRTGLAAPEGTPQAKVVLPHVAVAEADRFLDVIAGLDRLKPFDVAARRALERRKELIAAYAGSRPGNEIPKGPMGWTHGDFQPLNILWERSDVTAVLDWDRLAVRPCADELVRTAQVQFGTDDGRLDLVRITAFVAGYRSVISLTDDDLEDAVRRLWWRRMTGFWQLHWHYDKGDQGPDALWTSGGHMLDWWCERQDEVLDAFLER